MQDARAQPAANTSPPGILEGLHGRYRVVRALGQGGFGVTHLARRDGDDREVVIKQLRIDRMDDWKAFDLFEREAKVLEALKHPNIPAFVDHFEVKGEGRLRGFALVQEYVAGPTLRELQRQRPTPSATVMRPWLETLLDVLRYLHERTPPVIHRDISPKNVIVRGDGQPVLIDFGTVQNALRSADTISSTSAGTFGYAAPEQLIGRALPCSDLYGLAMTWLAVASGLEPEALPFAGNRVQASAALREHDTHPRLVLLLEELTDPDPDRRPASAADVLARLRAIPIVAPTSVAVSAPSESSIAHEVEARWRGRARRAAGAASARAFRPSNVPSTEELRECTIAADGSAALVELGFKEGRVARIDLRTFELEPWDTAGFPEVFHADVGFDLEGRSALLVSFSHGGLLTTSPGGPPRRHALQDLPSFMMARLSDRGAFAVSPDRKLLACLDQSVVLFLDLERGGIAQRIALDDRFATFARGLRFVPDGSAVLLEVTNETWIVDAKGEIQKLPDTRIAIADDGRTVAMAGEREVVVGIVESWTPLKWRETARRVGKVDERPERPTFSPDARWLALAVSERVTVIDVKGAREHMVAADPYRPDAPFQRIEHIGFDADGRRLLVVGDCALHPLATERDTSVAVYSLARREALGSVRLLDDREVPYGFTTLGIHGPLTGRGKKDGARVRALLCDEPPEQVLGDALDAALDFRDRAAFWGAEIGAGRLPEGIDPTPLVEASAGLTHLLPVAVKRAAEAAVGAPARFGAVGGDGSGPGASALLDALRWLHGKSEAERDVLFADMLAGEIARAEAQAARGEVAIGGARVPRAVLIAAAAVVLAALLVFALL